MFRDRSGDFSGGVPERVGRNDGRDLEGLIVRGSDHLTAYNLYAEAFTMSGYIGDVYGLQRHMFEAERIAHWAERRGVLVKALEDAALAMASVYRSVGLPLPQTLPIAPAAPADHSFHGSATPVDPRRRRS